MKRFCIGCLAVFLIITAGDYNYCAAASNYWTVYTAREGLTNNNITSLAVDPGGYLWIGTGDNQDPGKGGLSLLDRLDEFISFDSAHGFISNYVQAIAFENITPEHYDDLDQGAIWIATKKGLSVLNRRGAWMPVFSGNSMLPGDDILDVFIDRENTKWISIRGNGVCCVDAQHNREKHTVANGLCSNTILCMAQDSHGRLWFGSQESGASYLEQDGSWLTLSAENSGLIGNCVRNIIEEKPGRLWFVTPQGISVFDGQNWMSYSSRNSPFATLIPTCIAIDTAGNKWIGTENGGVLQLDTFGRWAQFQKENSQLLDNRITAIAAGNDGMLWIGTPSGLCSISASAQRIPILPQRDKLQKPAPDGLGQGAYGEFDDGVSWKNEEQAASGVTLSFALPVLSSPGKLWCYCAFWADGTFSFRDAHYGISGDRQGNLAFNITGSFAKAEFLTAGAALTSPRRVIIDKQRPCPFPQLYPEELEMYLLPGTTIPGTDPEVRKIADSLVTMQSRADMYRTARDIIYSPLFQHMAFDELQKERLPATVSSSNEAIQSGAGSEVLQMLKGGNGGRQAKARLLCSVARAAGIPARTVTGIGGAAWSQLWIAGNGWVPVETSYPVYNYVKAVRTSLPKLLYPEEYLTVFVSGTDDTGGRVWWAPQVKAVCQNADAAALKQYQKLAEAKLLLLKIATEEPVPDDAKLEISRNIFVAAVEKTGEVLALFQDQTGKDLHRMPLAFDGLSSRVDLGSQFMWRFVPRRIGQFLIIENLQCTSTPTVRQ